MTDVKLDTATTWLRTTTVGALLALVASATLIYASINTAIGNLQVGQDSIVRSVGEMRDELRKLVSENVSQRQSLAWLDLFQLTWSSWVEKLRSDNQSLKVSDFKVPPLPR